MIITDFTLYRTTLRCKKPFHIATLSVFVNRGLLLELRTDDGLIGWGEATPGPSITGESVEGCIHAIRNILMPAIVGLNPFEIEEAHRRMEERLSGNPSAKCAVDLALHDLAGKRSGQPVVRMLGGTLGSVATNYSIGLSTPEEAAREAAELCSEGYAAIKLKVGSDPEQDVRRVAAVRGAVGSGVALRLDANEGWQPPQAAWALKRMEPYDVELCEQPLERGQWAACAELRRQTSIRLAGDESIHTHQDALLSIQMGAFDVFNLKLMKSGGLWPLRRLVALARDNGILLMMGGMVGESSLGVTAAASLAHASRFEFADLDADLLLADTLATPALPLCDGRRVLSEEPGLGSSELDPQYLERLQ